MKSFVSHWREFKADADAARMIGDTRGLPSALPNVEASLRGDPMEIANEASSHLFTLSPLSDEPLRRLFAAQTPVAQRVERLRALAAEGPPAAPAAVPPA